MIKKCHNVIFPDDLIEQEGQFHLSILFTSFIIELIVFYKWFEGMLLMIYRIHHVWEVHQLSLLLCVTEFLLKWAFISLFIILKIFKCNCPFPSVIVFLLTILWYVSLSYYYSFHWACCSRSICLRRKHVFFQSKNHHCGNDMNIHSRWLGINWWQHRLIINMSTLVFEGSDNWLGFAIFLWTWAWNVVFGPNVLKNQLLSLLIGQWFLDGLLQPCGSLDHWILCSNLLTYWDVIGAKCWKDSWLWWQ